MQIIIATAMHSSIWGIRQDRNVPEFGVCLDKIQLWISGITFQELMLGAFQARF